DADGDLRDHVPGLVEARCDPEREPAADTERDQQDEDRPQQHLEVRMLVNDDLLAVTEQALWIRHRWPLPEQSLVDGASAGNRTAPERELLAGRPKMHDVTREDALPGTGGLRDHQRAGRLDLDGIPDQVAPAGDDLDLLPERQAAAAVLVEHAGVGEVTARLAPGGL